MAGSDFSDKAEAIQALRDTLATMRWEFMSGRKQLRRREIDAAQLRRDVYQAVEEYPPLDGEYEV